MLRIFALLLTVISAMGFAQLAAQQESPKQRPGPFLIYGPVHTIRDERATFKSENGTLVEGPKILVQTIEYDEDGTKQDRTSYESNGNIGYRSVERYEPDGRILETSSFQNGKLSSRVVSNYDDQKQLIEEVTYRPDASVSDRTVFRGHGNQSETESWSYDPQGNITSQSKSRYDQPSKRSSSITISPSAVVQSLSTVIDNPDGSREFRTEGSNGEFKRQVFIPIAKGREDRVTYNKDGTIKSTERHVREFDSYHNLIKDTRSMSKGDSSDFAPVDVTYRTITYFGKD